MKTTEALERVATALADCDAGRAINEMHTYLAAWPQQHTAELLQTVMADYERMTDYWLQGYEDPQRATLYEQLLHRLYRLYANLNVLENVKRSTLWSTAYTRVRQPGRTWSMDDVRSRMEGFVSDVALLELEPEHRRAVHSKEIYAEHGRWMNDLFDYVWTSRQWTDAVAATMEELLLSPTVDSNDQQLVVTAVMLSTMAVFDITKFRLLVNVYRQSADTAVRQRALVGWVLAAQPRWASLYAEQRALTDELLADTEVVSELTELQLQLVYCLNAEEDHQTIQQEIMPELMKHNNLTITRLGIEEREDDPMEDILNPEASEQRMEKLEEGFRRMMDMQQQGSDIYFGGFAQMKRFTFFYNMSNWLVPFYLQHPDISGAIERMNSSRFIEQLTTTGPFCNSDKYSFVLAFQHVVERMPQQLREMLERGEATMGEVPAEELRTPAYVRRSYLQDLYRFFRLFPQRSELPQPFDRHQPDGWCFFCQPTLLDSPALQEHSGEVVRLLMKCGMDETASRLLASYADEHRNSHYYILVGRLLTKHPDFAAHYPVEGLTPLLCYEKAVSMDENNERALTGYARQLFQAGRYLEAATIYDQLLAKHPDQHGIMLNKAVCLTNLKEYEEALQLLYRLNYEDNADRTVRRVLAWTLACSGRNEQAERIYEQLLAAEPIAAGDLLNGGFALWMAGKVDSALARFRHYKEQVEASNADFIDIEKPLLLQRGITVQEIRMMKWLLS